MSYTQHRFEQTNTIASGRMNGGKGDLGENDVKKRTANEIAFFVGAGLRPFFSIFFSILTNKYFFLEIFVWIFEISKSFTQHIAFHFHLFYEKRFLHMGSPWDSNPD